MFIRLQRGQLLVELVMVIGLTALIIPALLSGFIASIDSKPQQEKRVQAVALLKETETAVKSVRDNDWATFASVTKNAAYHPVISSNKWILQSGVATNSAGLTQSVVISNVYRDSGGAIASSPTGNTLDPSTLKVVLTVSWQKPIVSSSTSTIYLTRTTNLTKSHTSVSDFALGTLTNVQITSTSGGELKLANNNKAKWCSPTFNSNIIDLPDGPPVAVAATASATSVNIPNDVFVATAPYATSSTKLAYVNVPANVATPAATLKGIFTLDASKYSAGTYPSSLGGLTNNFKTNDVKYYTSSGGKLYALLATDDASHEIVVVQIKSGGTDSYQDPTNKIYKYWTYFNTKINSSAATNDQSPFSYGGVSVNVLGTRGYVISSGYLYVFDLSTIDTATTTTSLPMIGCRIQLDGYDCKPGTGQNKKYNSGETGATYTDTATPAHNDCSDGGNAELNADNDIVPVSVGGNTYVYVAVGAGTNPEFEIVNVTNVPTGATSPTLTNNSCGRISGGAAGWKMGGSLDFNTLSNTEEAANSVYANGAGTRAYVSSNGGIDGNSDGKADSKQFYIIDTSTKTAPKFLSTSSSGTGSVATSGFYDGASPAPTGDSELFPRRSLTVLNGLRAILVGKDGFANGNNAEEYQVLQMDSPDETTPKYCKGIDFDQGFNDLTSVSELDNENYVYMVANTKENNLKIIEGGPDNAIFVPLGTYESPVIDASTSAAFNRFITNIGQPASTTITMQVAVAAAVANVCPISNLAYTYVGPSGDSSTSFQVTNGTLTGLIPLLAYIPNYANPNQCFRYKVTFSTLNQLYTPELDDITVNYSY